VGIVQKHIARWCSSIISKSGSAKPILKMEGGGRKIKETFSFLDVKPSTFHLLMNIQHGGGIVVK
jgi:hypothetical protein